MLDGLSPARRRFVLGLRRGVLAWSRTVAAALIRREAARGRCRRTRRARCCWSPGTAARPRPSRCSPPRCAQPGRDATVVDLAGDGTGDLREQAEVLDEAVQRGAASGPAPRSVDVVGYSAGGVVARLWVARPRRRPVGPPDRDARLAAPRHRPGRAGRRPRARTRARRPASSWCPTATCCARSTPATRRPRARCGSRSGRPTTRSSCRRSPPSLDGALDFSVQSVCPAAQVIAHGDLPERPGGDRRCVLGSSSRRCGRPTRPPSASV